MYVTFTECLLAALLTKNLRFLRILWIMVTQLATTKTTNFVVSYTPAQYAILTPFSCCPALNYCV